MAIASDFFNVCINFAVIVPPYSGACSHWMSVFSSFSSFFLSFSWHVSREKGRVRDYQSVNTIKGLLVRKLLLRVCCPFDVTENVPEQF